MSGTTTPRQEHPYFLCSHDNNKQWPLILNSDLMFFFLSHLILSNNVEWLFLFWFKLQLKIVLQSLFNVWHDQKKNLVQFPPS